ncbi:hypothetical protein MNBD_UNCLBAC01-643 [hydrothermal vent metagenome]|uniref:Uncharacterized protein n=1 Tax=hydrothermal vent metagenome TaxID=652676 RepID=A0A3B1DFD6_9ZZZZ
MTSLNTILSPLFLFTSSQVSKIYDILNVDKEVIKNDVFPAMFLEVSEREIMRKNIGDQFSYQKGQVIKLEESSWKSGQEIFSHTSEPNHATDFVFNTAFLTGYKVPVNRSNDAVNKNRYYPPAAQLIKNLQLESNAGTVEIIKHPDKSNVENKKQVLPGDILLMGD